MNIVPPVANRLMRMQSVKSFFFPTISQIAINYRDASLSDHAGDGEFDVKAGDRMPWFEVDGESIYDRLRKPCFHLLVFSKTGRSVEGGALFDVHMLPLLPQAMQAFGAKHGFTVLLRPDNYIAWVSSDTPPQRVQRYLERTLGMFTQRA